MDLWYYQVAKVIARSSNGRTGAFEAPYLGSNPSLAARIGKAGCMPVFSMRKRKDIGDEKRLSIVYD